MYLMRFLQQSNNATDFEMENLEKTLGKNFEKKNFNHLQKNLNSSS